MGCFWDLLNRRGSTSIKKIAGRNFELQMKLCPITEFFNVQSGAAQYFKQNKITVSQVGKKAFRLFK